MKNNCILIFLILINFSVFAQENEDKDEYTYETVWGVSKNTSSGLIGGFIFRKSVKNNKKSYTSYGVELMNIKHIAESKRTVNEGASFTVGKVNYLYSIRGQYGRDYLLFRKKNRQGIQVNLNVTAGPSIGLESPYYIEYKEGKPVPYDPKKHFIAGITNKGFFLRGLFESKVIIGANFKTSLSFSSKTLKSDLVGVEIGFLLDAYTRKVIIIAEAENYAIWPTSFITLFYGIRK